MKKFIKNCIRNNSHITCKIKQEKYHLSISLEFFDKSGKLMIYYNVEKFMEPLKAF